MTFRHDFDLRFASSLEEKKSTLVETKQSSSQPPKEINQIQNTSLVTHSLGAFTNDPRRKVSHAGGDRRKIIPVLGFLDGSSAKPFCLRRSFNPTIDLQAYFTGLQSLVTQTPPHPSVLVCKAIVRDGDEGSAKFSALFEPFEEDLSSFIARRGSKAQYLTQAELLWISRQLIAALAAWQSHQVVHGNIRLENVVYARNGQAQTLFKIGRLCDEQWYSHLRTTDFAENFAIDMLFYGFMTYELITMKSCEDEISHALCQSDPQTALKKLAADYRTVLQGEKVRARYPQMKILLDSVCELLDNSRDPKLTPKYFQLEWIKIDTTGLSMDPSVPGEDTVPAGSGDHIVKQAQAGLSEYQYPLALLLRERGHMVQAYAWGKKAAEQGHVQASRLVGLMELKAEGTPKNIEKAVEWLRKAADKGDVEAQQALATLGQEIKPDWSILADTRADLALRLEHDGGDEKQMASIKTNMAMAAEQGCPIAQLWTALKHKEAKEDKHADHWLQKLLALTDVYLTLGNERGILAAASACLPIPETIHPFQITGLTHKVAMTAVGKLRKNNLDIAVIKFPRESLQEMVQYLLRLPRVPKHPNLVPILGVSGHLEVATTSISQTYPLAAIIPLAGRRLMADFLETSGRTVSAEQLATWAFHLVSALKALHDEKLTHGNISANNIWINEKQAAILGLGDFPDVTEQSYADDVFALGLTLFGIATKSDKWKNGIKNEAEMKQVMEHLSKTSSEDFIRQFPVSENPAMQAFYQLMMECLNADVSKRPTLQQLQDSLVKITNLLLPEVVEFDEKEYNDQLYHQAMKLLTSYQPKVALQLLREAAAAGHSEAALQAAYLLCSGKSVPLNQDEAARLIKSVGKSFLREEFYARAMGEWANNPVFSLLLLKEAAKAGHQEAQAEAATILYNGISVPADRIEAVRICEPLFKSMTPKQIYQWGVRQSASHPRFAFMLLCEAANAGFLEAQTRAADICWNEMNAIHSGKRPSPENKYADIHYCVELARHYWNMAATNTATTDTQRTALQERLEALAKFESAAALPPPPVVVAALVPAAAPVVTPAEYLRLAFQHFFGLDVLRDLELTRDNLIMAAEGNPADPNTKLARSILSLSTNPLDETCPLRFFVPGGDFEAPFVELDPTVYCVPGTAYRCSIVGRIAVLIEPSGLQDQDTVAWLNRAAHAHPNVIGPISMTATVNAVGVFGARTLSQALLYAPVQATPANRNMVSDPTTAMSRLLPFLVGAAEGLAHLHRSRVIHGNVSLPYLLVGNDRLGLIASGPPSCRRATAPESLSNNHFSTASDVFQFGLVIANIVTGGTYEDAWLPQAGEIDPKTRLARLAAAVANGYADIRARIPAWCYASLVDIMMRCLRPDRTQRPTMEAVAQEIQTLRQTIANHGIAQVTRPSQFWLHTSHICSELTVDYPMLRIGGTLECLYGPRIRDRLQQNFNPNTNHAKTFEDKKAPGVMQSKSYGTATGPHSVLDYPNLAASTQKIMKYKARFFLEAQLSSWDGSVVPSSGARHLPGHARGAILMDDKRLSVFVDRLDKAPCYELNKVKCSGAPEECKCERAARPKNPKVITDLALVLMQMVHSCLEMEDYAALAGVCKFTAQAAENNMIYWRGLLKEHANQGLTYISQEWFMTKKERGVEQKDGTSTQTGAPSDELKQRDPLVRRWAKMHGTQQLYARLYTTLELETTDVLHIPDITREERKQLIDKARDEFQARRHACTLDGKPVRFSEHFADARTKTVGGVFMACGDCLTHNVWSLTEASQLYGFTNKQLEKIPFWRLNTAKHFITADLDEIRLEKDMRKRLKVPKSIDKKVWDRYPDLPASIRQFVFVYPAHPKIPQQQMVFTVKEDKSESAAAMAPATSRSDVLTVVTDRPFTPSPDKFYVIYHKQGFFAARQAAEQDRKEHKQTQAPARRQGNM